MTLIGNLFRWIHGKLSNRPTNFSWVIENKLAGKKTQYYVCLRSEESLRKQRNPTMKQTSFHTGNLIVFLSSLLQAVGFHWSSKGQLIPAWNIHTRNQNENNVKIFTR